MHRCAPLHEARGLWLSHIGAATNCVLASWCLGTLQLVGVAVLGVGLQPGHVLGYVVAGRACVGLHPMCGGWFMHRCAPLHEAKGPWLSQAGATTSCVLAS